MIALILAVAFLYVVTAFVSYRIGHSNGRFDAMRDMGVDHAQD